jgi:hypothetical protein
MSEVIKTLLDAGGSGIFIICFSIAVVVLLAILLVKPLIKPIGKAVEKIAERIRGLGPAKFAGEAKNDIEVGVVTPSGKIKLDPAKFGVIEKLIETSFDDYTARRRQIIADHNKDYYRKRDKCIDNAIRTIQINYRTEVTEGRAASRADDSVFGLFLEVFVGKTLREQLIVLKNNSRLPEMSTEEQNDEVGSLVRECVDKMKQQISDFMGLDTDAFSTIYKAAAETLRDEIKSTITQFIKLSRIEQEELLKEKQERIDLLKSQIKQILE